MPFEDYRLGRLCLYVACLSCVVYGADYGYKCLDLLVQKQALPSTASWYDRAALLCGVAAAFCFYAYRNYLGLPGWAGLAKSMIMQFYVAMFAGMIVGTCFLPILGTMYAPLLIIQVGFSDPLFAMTHAGYGFLAHLLMGVWQRHRINQFDRRLMAFSL